MNANAPPFVPSQPNRFPSENISNVMIARAFTCDFFLFKLAEYPDTRTNDLSNLLLE